MYFPCYECTLRYPVSQRTFTARKIHTYRTNFPFFFKISTLDTQKEKDICPICMFFPCYECTLRYPVSQSTVIARKIHTYRTNFRFFLKISTLDTQKEKEICPICMYFPCYECTLRYPVSQSTFIARKIHTYRTNFFFFS